MQMTHGVLKTIQCHLKVFHVHNIVRLITLLKYTAGLPFNLEVSSKNDLQFAARLGSYISPEKV